MKYIDSNEFSGGQPYFTGIDLYRIHQLERQNKWYELDYTVGEASQQYPYQDPATIAKRISDPRSGMRELAQYAAQYGTFFLITIGREANGTDTWTVMPAFLDKKVWQGNVSERYQERLSNAWAHIIVDPGEDLVRDYRDSEQLGVMDDYCMGVDTYTGAGMFAFDVSAVDGIRLDAYHPGRHKVAIKEVEWFDWNLEPSSKHTFEYTGPKDEVKQLAGRTALEF